MNDKKKKMITTVNAPRIIFGWNKSSQSFLSEILRQYLKGNQKHQSRFGFIRKKRHIANMTYL